MPKSVGFKDTEILGLKLVNDLVKQIHGTIELEIYKKEKEKVNKKKIFYVLLSFLIVLGFVTGLEAQKIKVVNGVEIISNPKNPKAPKDVPSKLVLKEDFTVGDSENLDEMISEVSFLTVDDHDNLFAVDIKEMNVKVYDSSGEYVRTIGRKGQGPGELNIPTGILITPDNQLLILDIINRRMSYFTLEGEFTKNVSIADKTSLANLVMDDKGNMAAMELVLEGKQMFWYIRKYDKDLKPLFDINKVEFIIPVAGKKMNPFDFTQLNVFDSKSNLYFGDGKDYVIKIFAPEGKHFRTIEKKYDPTKITKEDIQQMLESIPNVTGVNIKDMLEFPKYYPAYESVTLDEDGRLFVRSYKKGKEKDVFFLDIFSTDGKYFSTLATKANPRFWKNGKMYSVEENDDDIKIIKRYSVSWKN